MVPRKANTTIKKAAPRKTTAVKKSTTQVPTIPNDTPTHRPNRQSNIGAVGRTGNVGSIEELQYSPQARAWIRFSLGYSPWNPQTREKGETVWYRCIAFGSLAENIAQTVNVGMRVVVSGRPDINEWTDEQGEKHQQ